MSTFYVVRCEPGKILSNALKKEGAARAAWLSSVSIPTIAQAIVQSS